MRGAPAQAGGQRLPNSVSIHWSSQLSRKRSYSSNIRNDLLEKLSHLIGHLAEFRVVDCAHRRHGIDRGNFHRASVALLYHHVAGEHRPDLVLKRESFVGEFWAACSQNEVGPEIDTDFFVQGVLHVDLCEVAATAVSNGMLTIFEK
jgi:hypothetical protein